MRYDSPPPTSRQLANRLRTCLEWIDDHVDALPNGWRVYTSDNEPPEIRWHNGYPNGLAAEALVQQFGTPQDARSIGSIGWVEWSAEGMRPTLVAFTSETVAKRWAETLADKVEVAS